MWSCHGVILYWGDLLETYKQGKTLINALKKKGLINFITKWIINLYNLIYCISDDFYLDHTSIEVFHLIYLHGQSK